MTYALRFDDPNATDLRLVGGKGINLGRLTQAGFPVPPGFTVSTDAYRDFIATNNLRVVIADILATVRMTDADDLDRKAQSIRSHIERAKIPDALGAAITDGYRRLGDDEFVAVRSSSTAEDLAETSFAGQHDTYLDMCGEASVLDAVRRCWASMWSARAIAYRNKNGIDQDAVGMAVVVQKMISSDVAGVMFTANPMTGAVDEIVINASWGLGEGVVSGIVTPDQFVLSRDTLALKDTQVGSKAMRVVRNRETGLGTVTEDVPAAEASKTTMSTETLRDLAAVGRSVQDFYEGYPQDIEWAYAEGKFYLLQSRDITGLDPCWDEDLDNFESCAPEIPGTVWTRAWADMVWSDAVTPLFYSIRTEMVAGVHSYSENLWGLEDVAKLRMLKYHKGRVYYNSRVDYYNYGRLMPPSFRVPDLLAFMPRSWHKDILEEPWSLFTPFKALARIELLHRNIGPYKLFDHIYRTMETKREEGDGLKTKELQALSDTALKRYVNSRLAYQTEWVINVWSSFFIYLPMALSLLGGMIAKWYEGTNKFILSDLITGLDKPTITLKENAELWKLANLIRDNEALRALFSRYEGSLFFEKIKDEPAAAEFNQAYAGFISEFGHRGHSDRDIYADRRVENPGIDYAHFKSMLSADGKSPSENIEKLIARRKAATEDFIDSIRRHPPFAALKVEAFLTLHAWLLKFFAMRDDQRHYTDRVTFSKKRAIGEVARRLIDRGVLSGDDFYFLSKNELFELLDGKRADRVTIDKIAGRRRNFHKVEGGAKGPAYIRDGKYLDLDRDETVEVPGNGLFRGIGTSRGHVTGIARIIPTHKEIGRVKQGDILITSATDPGWTPVFLVISGLVLETGGMLAHGSCISREYGIPAVQVPHAMSLIKDGSRISVDGDTGEVRVLAEPEAD